MIVLIMLFIILSLSFSIKIKLKITQEEAIFMAVFGMVIFSYIVGLVNLLGLSIYIIAIVSLISIIYVIIKLKKKEEKIENLITLPTVIYILVIFLIYYIVKDIKFGYYDEFMFWGTNLKEMVKKSCLWANLQMDGIHLTYPPFTAVSEYIFCKFNGEFNEGTAYLGMISLMFTSLMPLLKNEKYNIKSFFKIVMTILVTYIAIILFQYNIANLSVDCILGVVFAVAMYMAYTVKDKKDYIVLIILLISLTLIKTNGILFAGIVIMQLFFREVLELIKQKERNLKEIARKFSIVGILLVIIISNYGIWQIYCTLNGKKVDDRHDKNNVEKINITEFVDALMLKEGASERNKKIVIDFFDKIINDKIIRKYYLNTTIWIFAIIDVCFIVYFIIDKEKIKNIANFLSINIGFVLYILTNLLMFMFVFQKYQGEIQMGFERYIQTYMLAMTLNLIYILLKKVNMKTGIIIIGITLIMQNGLNKLMIDPRLTVRSTIDAKIIEDASQINNNVEESKKVYIIDQQEDYGFEFMKTRYLISPRKTNLLYEWNIGKSTEDIYYKLAITETELIDKMISEEYDYIYIISIKESFLEDYKNIFSDGIKEKLKKIVIDEEFERINSNGILLKFNKETRKIENIE